MNETATYTPNRPSQRSFAGRPPAGGFADDDHSDRENLIRAGAAALLGLAWRQRSIAAFGGASAAAIPLLVRAATGHWPAAGGGTAVAGARSTRRPISVHAVLSVRRSPEEVYAAWRDLPRLPEILRHVHQVEDLGQRRSRWSATSPVGKRVQWTAEITEDDPGRRLAWRSTADSEVRHHGSLELEPGPPDRGTRVVVRFEIDPPGALAGRAAAPLLEPLTEREVREDLRRFKNFLEAGEVPTTDGQPHGERGMLSPSNPF
ncbi:MAG TPA: SRPBCC family protein [Thermoanaerobaculia bacterium]|nr:SRPBCC family protein [Thermoanaerobaculia bacterium]